MVFKDKIPIVAALTLFVLALTIIRHASPTFAQEGTAASTEAQTKAAAEETPPPPKAIPPADIVSQGANTMSRLAAIRQSSSFGDSRRGLEAGLAELTETLKRLAETPESQNPENFSLRNLDVVRQEWARYKGKIEGWAATVEKQSKVLQTNLDEIDALEVVWVTTREGAAEVELPEAIVHEVDTVLMELGRTDAIVMAEMDSMLTLETRLGNKANLAKDYIQRIHDAVATRGIIHFEQPPIWKSIADRDTTFSLRAEISKTWRRTGLSVRDFWHDYNHRIIGHGSAMLVLIVLLLLLRYRSRQWEVDDETLQASLRIFDQAVPAAILVSLLPFGRIYVDAPVAVMDLIQLLVLPVLVFLLPVIVDRRLLRPMYAFFAVFAFYKARLLFGSETLHRFSLLFVTAVCLAGTLLWLRRAPRMGLGGRLYTVGMGMARIASVVLGVALIANALGPVSLSEMLTGASLMSAFALVLAFAGVRVLGGLVVLGLRSRTLNRLGSIRDYGDVVRQRLLGFLRLFFVVLWILVALKEFQILPTVLSALRAIFGASWVIGSVTISLGSIILFGVTLWAATLISRFLQFSLEKDILPRARLPRGVPATISKLVNYGVISIGFFVAVAAAGFQVTQFSIIIGALGVGIGFGLQTVVNNFVSGLILIFERPIQTGDTIEIAALIGTVRHIGIRASTIRTFDGADVLVPNGDLLAGQLVNWTLSDYLRRIEIPVGVTYGTDPSTVQELLKKVAVDHESSLESPEPAALFLGFGDSSLDFALRFWTSDFDNWRRIQSDVTVNIYKALKDADIEIPFPQRDLHLRSVDESIGGLPSRRVEGSDDGISTRGGKKPVEPTE